MSNPSPTISAIAAKAAEAGIQTTFWSKADKIRLYAKTGRRDAKVFLEFDDADGDVAALKIFIDECGQAPAWYASQRAALQERFKPLFLAYVAVSYTDTPAAPNGYGSDINAMIDEARTFFAALAVGADEQE